MFNKLLDYLINHKYNLLIFSLCTLVLYINIPYFEKTRQHYKIKHEFNKQHLVKEHYVQLENNKKNLA